jgi:hypothetical protein
MTTQTRDITYAQIRYALREWEALRGDGSINVMGALGAARISQPNWREQLDEE